MIEDNGRVPSEPGSREPSPAVSAASGFDPSRIRRRFAFMRDWLGGDVSHYFADRDGEWTLGGLLDEIEQLIPARAEDKWTPWPGGPCPVGADAIVDVKWNNGAVSRESRAGAYAVGDVDLWQSRGHGGHIIAYRVLRDSDGSPEGGDACGSVHDSAGRRHRPSPTPKGPQ